MESTNIIKTAEDISKQKPFVSGVIDKVGIEDLEIPIKIQMNSQIIQVQAKVNAMVSLDDKNMRGIHMSRIYLSLHKFLENKVLNLQTLEELLDILIKSQKGISHSAYLKFSWDLPIKRKALKSEGLEGWRYYPVFYEGKLSKNKKKEFIMGMNITYSSTCPCSASLSRSLIQKKFQKDFTDSSFVDAKKMIDWLGKEQSIAATPHAQKSVAYIKLKTKQETQSLIELINETEQILETAVQTAVKKTDEQEFAKLNSQNLMFSEDAGRRIKNLLDQKSWINDFDIYIKHFESLHPFEVACHITKYNLSDL